MQEELKPIVARLRAADRSHQKEQGGIYLLRAVKYFLGLILLAFAIDVFLHLSSGHRVLFLAGMGVVLLFLAARTYYIACVRENSPEHIARLLENRDAALGSQLINILQLDAQTTDPTLPPLTRDLAQQAIEDYGRRLAGTKIERHARTAQIKAEWKRAGWAMLAFVALLGVAFKITVVELARFIDPYGDHPPYSFTQLEIVEPDSKGLQVVYKKGALIKVRHTGHRPGELFLTFHPPDRPEQSTTVPMFSKGDLGFYQQIDNIQSDLVIFAHTRNQHSRSRKRSIEVLLTPKLDKAYLQITPPAYTGLKPEEKPYQFKNARALAGSEMRFRIQSNRPLRSGTIELLKTETDVQRVSMEKTADNEVAGMIDARDSCRLRFSVVDADGIVSEDIWEGSLTITYDLSPAIHISNPSKDCFVSMDFKIEAQIEASDDYGLRTIRIHRALNRVYSAPKVIEFASVTRHAREMLPFDFQDLGIRSGDVISLFAEAIDTAPEPNFARSQTINIAVISEEEYNTFLRQQKDINDIQGKYTELMNQLHELVEEQRKLAAAAAELRDRLAKAGPEQQEALQEELDRLLAQQNEVNQKLNKLAGQMESFVRTNPLYDVENEFQARLAAHAQRIRESTGANDAGMKDIAGRSSPPAGRQLDASMLNDFESAAEEQAARLGGVEQEAREEITSTLQDMSKLQELLKDFNRFEQIYRVQEALADQARAYNRNEPLGREDQLALKDLAATEREVGEELERLEETLREHAKAAKELFPKAAQGATDLADQMREQRLGSLARQATGAMLSGNGAGSYQMSERLRGEMEKMFGECNAQGGEMADELDTYLRLTRGMNPGRSFQQMLQSRKFGDGQGRGFQFGQGDGQAGQSGFSVMTAPNMDVFGNESFISSSGDPGTQPNPAGFGPSGNPNDGPSVALDKSDVLKGLNPVNRESEAVTAESIIEEYNDIVERYFRTITK